MKETSIIKDDDADDDRSFFHMFVTETSIIKYDDDDDDYRSSFHILVTETASSIAIIIIMFYNRSFFHRPVK